MSEIEGGRRSRREVIVQAGVAGAIVWTAPVVVSTRAWAAGTLAPTTTTTAPPPPIILIPTMGSGDLGGAGGVVMDANGNAWRTPDQGNTWVRATSSPVGFSPIAMGGVGEYAAVDGAGVLWYGTDFIGDNWAQSVAPPAGGPTFITGFFGDVVTDAAGNSANGSADTWTADTIPLSSLLGGASVTILAAGGFNLTIALDNTGQAYTNHPLGSGSWSAATTSPADLVPPVVPTIASGMASATHVALDAAGASAFSADDGVTWAAAATSISSLGGAPTLVAGGRFPAFVALDAAGHAWRTPDGSVWSLASTSIADLDPNAVVTVVVGGNQAPAGGHVFAAVGSTSGGASAAWFTNDGGATWQVAATPPT